MVMLMQPDVVVAREQRKAVLVDVGILSDEGMWETGETPEILGRTGAGLERDSGASGDQSVLGSN